jgi:hypothetical protein
MLLIYYHGQFFCTDALDYSHILIKDYGSQMQHPLGLEITVNILMFKDLDRFMLSYFLSDIAFYSLLL